MKEDKITKRIKELQNDRRFMFKLTDDIIALVYRTAIEDYSKEKKDPDKSYKKDITDVDPDEIADEIIVRTSKELNKKFGTKGKLGPWEKEQRIKEYDMKIKCEAYSDILKYIENHSDLMDVYIYVKEKAKEFYDIKTPNPGRCP